jgi:death-on-curing protein
MRLLTLEQLIESFRLVEGAEPIVRDLGLLESAVHRQHSAAFGVELYPTLDLKVAALMDAISRSHPLIDGNKRLTLIAARMTFYFNDRRNLAVDEEELYDLILRCSDEHMEIADLATELAVVFVK